MSRESNRSTWTEEVQYGEIYQNFELDALPDNVFNGAYEAFNRFYQKEQKRSKHPKRRKDCWQ